MQEEGCNFPPSAGRCVTRSRGAFPPGSPIGADRLSCASQGLPGLPPRGSVAFITPAPHSLSRRGVFCPLCKRAPGTMERASGPLQAAFSNPVLESKAPGAPLDCKETDCGSPSPRGDGIGASQSAAELPACPEDAIPPATPHRNQLLALGVLPASASPAFTAPGQPRDSARWMLCVAGAKLKVEIHGSRLPDEPSQTIDFVLLCLSVNTQQAYSAWNGDHIPQAGRQNF